jgi:GAF domain-containing protein
MDMNLHVQRLCADFEHRATKRVDFLESCSKLVAAAVGCSRAGIWLFQGEKPHLRLHCIAMYDAVHQRMTQVPDERGPAVEEYLLALEHTGHVLATDARAHFATAGFFADRLRANGVRSLLAAAFSVNGRLYGGFTCTQVGSEMEWTRGQLAVLRLIGSRVSLALADAERAPTETQPSLLS